MASSSEKSTLASLAVSKGFKEFPHGNVHETPAGVGTWFVYSAVGKPFKANMDLTAVTNYLNTF